MLPRFHHGEPLRLLWLIDSLAPGGAEALTVELMRAHDPRRLAPRVAFLKRLQGNPYEAELRALGVPLVCLDARHLRDLAAFRRLRRLLREQRIELVHAHLAYATIWGALAGRLERRPVVATLHVRPPRARLMSREGARRRLLVALVNRGAAGALAVSEAVRRAWLEEAGLRPERCAVVWNGIDLRRFAPDDSGEQRAAARQEWAIPPGSLVVACVAALRPGKGLEDLLAAAPAVVARHPAALLLIAGDGPLRPPLEGQARQLSLGDRVRFCGRVADVPALLAAADLFVLPSHADAFPTALLEAMAAGLPVLATRAGGIPEIVAEGETGELVPPGRPELLAAGMQSLVADSARRRALGEAGLRRAEEHFSVLAWLRRLEAVYGEALRGAEQGTTP